LLFFFFFLGLCQVVLCYNQYKLNNSSDPI
jgi:hypothetical protein